MRELGALAALLPLLLWAVETGVVPLRLPSPAARHTVRATAHLPWAPSPLPPGAPNSILKDRAVRLFDGRPPADVQQPLQRVAHQQRAVHSRQTQRPTRSQVRGRRGGQLIAAAAPAAAREGAVDAAELVGRHERAVGRECDRLC